MESGASPVLRAVLTAAVCTFRLCVIVLDSANVEFVRSGASWTTSCVRSTSCLNMPELEAAVALDRFSDVCLGAEKPVPQLDVLRWLTREAEDHRCCRPELAVDTLLDSAYVVGVRFLL